MHRINEIRSNTDICSWYYIPGHLNVADDLTRKKGFEILVPTCCWFNGPEFLHKSSETWGNEVCSLKNNKIWRRSNVTSNTISTPSVDTYLELNWRYYSSWSKLLLHVSIILKLKSNWLKGKRGETDRENFKQFSIKDIRKANIEICKLVQKKYFNEELISLSTKNELNKTSRILLLDPFMKNEVMCW